MPERASGQATLHAVGGDYPLSVRVGGFLGDILIKTNSAERRGQDVVVIGSPPPACLLLNPETPGTYAVPDGACDAAAAAVIGPFGTPKSIQ